MNDDAADRPARRLALYFLLLAVQTLAACLLFLAMFPLFQQVVAQSGKPVLLHGSTVIAAMAAALVMQASYWTRYRRVPVRAPVHGAAIGHLVLFASRVSFFFSGAVFSAIFFRHVPQLDVLPPAGQGVAKAMWVMALLFASFCYSLELERLGRAIADGDRRTA